MCVRLNSFSKFLAMVDLLPLLSLLVGCCTVPWSLICLGWFWKGRNEWPIKERMPRLVTLIGILIFLYVQISFYTVYASSKKDLHLCWLIVFSNYVLTPMPSVCFILRMVKLYCSYVCAVSSEFFQEDQRLVHALQRLSRYRFFSSESRLLSVCFGFFCFHVSLFLVITSINRMWTASIRQCSALTANSDAVLTTLWSIYVCVIIVLWVLLSRIPFRDTLCLKTELKWLSLFTLGISIVGASTKLAFPQLAQEYATDVWFNVAVLLVSYYFLFIYPSKKRFRKPTSSSLSSSSSSCPSPSSSPEHSSRVLGALTLQSFLERHLRGEDRSFFDFLQGEFSQENLLFWCEVERLKELQNNNQTIPFELASNVYKLFLDPRAPYLVNVPFQIFRDIQEAMESQEGHLNSNVFDEAQKEIYNLMLNDSFTRFMNTASYTTVTVELSSH